MAASFNTRFRFFVDRPGVMQRVGRWKHATLSRVGAYGRGAMRNQIKPPLKNKRLRTVTINGRQYFVPARGMVIDVQTGRPANRQQADQARLAAFANLRGQGVGRPPRRGPTDKLRRFMDFGIDNNETVVIGAWPFPKQPSLVGVVSVPELLNKGGGEFIGSQLVQYGPRPFVEPTLPPVARKMRQLVEQRPIHKF